MLSLSTFAQSTETKIIIIGNNVGTKNMTFKQVKDVLSGNVKRWNNNLSVKIVLPSSKHPHANTVAKSLYLSTYSGMQKFWLTLVFQGKAKPPIFLKSNKEIIEYINKNSGSIGVIYDNPKFITQSNILYSK
jgi:ABC-type phosphate transport system substrate-binding protein